MKATLTIVVVALGLVVSVVTGLAHHSVPAQYDLSRLITIRGVVTKTEWANPHARIWVDAKNDDGTISSWEMELPPPNVLRRENARMDFVELGDQVTLNVWRAKDGSRLAHTVTLV